MLSSSPLSRSPLTPIDLNHPSPYTTHTPYTPDSSSASFGPLELDDHTSPDTIDIHLDESENDESQAKTERAWPHSTPKRSSGRNRLKMSNSQEKARWRELFRPIWHDAVKEDEQMPDVRRYDQARRTRRSSWNDTCDAPDSMVS
jgi:hypothetical protein